MSTKTLTRPWVAEGESVGERERRERALQRLQRLVIVDETAAGEVLAEAQALLAKLDARDLRATQTQCLLADLAKEAPQARFYRTATALREGLVTELAATVAERDSALYQAVRVLLLDLPDGGGE